MIKIVIVTSGQPSANPRAVKEALLLMDGGYDVTFIYCPLSPWADAFDAKLMSTNHQISWIEVGAHPEKSKWKFRYARLRRKLNNIFSKSVRSYILFSQELKAAALKYPADLYIAHNLGAIAAAVAAAKKHNGKAGFDAEDFHRGEFADGDPQKDTAVAIENKYFPMLDYCTVASPLIGKTYSDLFPGKVFTVINNVFSLTHHAKPSERVTGLRLFWFSQFIGPARGLETVVDALNKLAANDIRLHLMGNIKPSYRQFLLKRISDKAQLLFIDPVSPEKVFKISATFDIGLATEVPVTANRDLCLTNKIFTYLLSGNAMLMSATSAQKAFAQDFPGVALLYNNDNADGLAVCIKKLYENRELLDQMKYNALKLAREKLNWEKESIVLEHLIEETLNDSCKRS